MNKIRRISLVLTILMLTGCVASHTPVDYPAEANRSLSKIEVRGLGQESKERADRLMRLWADNPEYVEWIRQDSPPSAKLPRLVSSSVPSYPLIPYLSQTKARVVLSIVIDERGSVAAARVYESSDSRFDHSAIEAVTKWKFLPAETLEGPVLHMLLVPMSFAPKEKRK